MTHRRRRALLVAPSALAVLLLAAAGCAAPTAPGTAPTPSPAPETTTASPAAIPTTTTVIPTTAPAGPCDPVAAFDRAHFSHPTTVDNQWLPLVPGTQFTYQGRSNRNGATLPHQLVTTVTDLTKPVDGVPTVVVWETDVDEGKLAEAELQFDAQDDVGNVWVLGEYPEEYDEGTFTGAPSTWISGTGGAVGGVLMRGDPERGRAGYRQGSVPEIKFLDCAKVISTDERVCVAPRCYDHVLVTDETSPLAAGSGVQRKYNAPGVGTVQVAAVDDPEGETLVLTRVVHLSAPELATARAAAQQLEKHAYQVSKVYARSTPIG